MTEIRIEKLSKIEGHARLVVTISKNEVKDVKLDVTEGARFFESLVRGHSCTEIPITAARICGFCSQAHQVTAINAVEDALGLSVSEQSLKLRELLQIAQIISSHALHLYFLALPDYLGFASAIEMAPARPADFKRAMALKRVSTELCLSVGGREINAVTAAVGGFRSVPTKARLEALLDSVKNAKADAVETARLFGSLDYPAFERRTQYFSLKNYLVSGKEVVLNSFGRNAKTWKASGKKFFEEVSEEVVDGSTAKKHAFGGKPYLTGALARVNNNFSFLSDDAREVALESSIRFPSFTPFANNFAQAIELVHFLDEATELIEELIPKIRVEPLHALEFRKATGRALSEAPRGVLYHEYSLDERGMVRDARIITPTQQNVRNIEEDLKALLRELIASASAQRAGGPPNQVRRSLPKQKLVAEIEKLVRAYDPCFSCAAHFLELKLNKIK